MSSRRQVPPVMVIGEVNYPLENILQQKEKIYSNNGLTNIIQQGTALKSTTLQNTFNNAQPNI